MTWHDDDARARRHYPEIIQLVAPYVIRPASSQDDIHRATDLLADARIAVRVRDFGYLKDYMHQFTIRHGRPNGTETELRKIVSGYGDYLFYGFEDESGMRIADWQLVDLRILRVQLNERLFHTDAGQWPDGCVVKTNGDASSTFIAFPRDWPCVVAGSSGSSRPQPLFTNDELDAIALRDSA